MELGVHYIDFLPGAERMAPTLAAAAKAAEEGGATMFTLADHFFQMEGMGRAEDPFLEGYTSMGFLAGQTRTHPLTMLVTGVTYRYPGVLAKTVTTLDVLSGGRSMFGIGAAWYEREHLALGVPYPPVAERFEMLEETLQICDQMWSDDDGPYEGKHYRLAETICQPQPIRRPPILIGGGGERRRCGWSRSTPTCGTAPRPSTSFRTRSTCCDGIAMRRARSRGHPADRRVLRRPLRRRRRLPPHARPLRRARRRPDQYRTAPGDPDPVGWVKRLGDEVIPRLADMPRPQ